MIGKADSRPNIIFIMADDHAAHAMSCYGSKINTTPNMDRIANKGMRFDNCFCTNSICTPSRATILTGTYNHINKVTTLATELDPEMVTYPKILQEAGYQTAMIGKWHLHSVPAGYDHYEVLWSHWGHGTYFDPKTLRNGEEVEHKGYVTDLITDWSIDWMKARDKDKPFCMMVHHKAPHRTWESSPRHRSMFGKEDIPYPPTFDDDYSNRSQAAKRAHMRIESDFNASDLKVENPEGVGVWEALPVPDPDNISSYSLKTHEGETIKFKNLDELKKWKYQRYLKDYLRCVASMDDGIGRILDTLDEEGITEDTMVVYTSDQGFFLGDHGWFDKRFMYEESLRMPFVVSYPRGIKAGSVSKDMILNVDFAQTFLDLAGLKAPAEMQGRSFRPLLEGKTPSDWRKSMYYRYWMHKADHYVPAHYGLRTMDYKLIYYYGDALGQKGAVGKPTKPEWELFDLKKDPMELNNVYEDPAYTDILPGLKDELHRLQAEVKDTPYKGK